MFDPTIYENLKVVLEGAVYDLDLSDSILVTGRSDRIDLSTMSREYAIEFKLQKESSPIAEISLYAGMSDLAAEILEQKESSPGCVIQVALQMEVNDPSSSCPDIQRELEKIWGYRPQILQTLSYIFGMESKSYSNLIRLSFGRKLDEGQIQDLPDLIDHTLQSLRWLGELSERY